MKYLIVVILMSLPGHFLCDCSGGDDALSDKRIKTHCSNDSTCPTWFICNSENSCRCDNRYSDVIICNDNDLTSAVYNCICVTYDIETRSTFAGACLYNCMQRVTHGNRKLPIQQLPNKPELLVNLNYSMCAVFHRAGLLCGECEEGYSPFVFSYNVSCVECPDGHKNWWKLLLAGFMPLTFLYFIVLLCNINVTSSQLHGVVWFSQVISTPAFVRMVLLSLSFENQEQLMLARVIAVFYSFWNLDIFRSVIPDICLNVTNLQTLALEYFIAFTHFC